MSAVLLSSSLLLSPSISIVATAAPANCPQSAKYYQEQFVADGRPMAMVCYLYAVQRDPTSVGPTPAETPINDKHLVDIYGRRVRDQKLIFDELWRPLPGFEKVFYDTKTTSRFYTNGVTMLQIMGTSTLGNNPTKVAILVNCSDLTLTYEGVARRRTRLYDYADQYKLETNFPQDRVGQICDAIGEPPIRIKPR